MSGRPTPTVPARRAGTAYLWAALAALLILLMASGCSAGNAVEVLGFKLQSPSARYLEQGERLAAEGRTAEAILAYRQAVLQDERNVAALRRLAAAYTAQGRTRAGLRLLRQAAALRPADAALAGDITRLTEAAAPAGPLALRWLAETGAAPPTGLAAGSDALYVALEDGSVAALDRAAGGVRWRIALPAKATSAPAIAGNLLLVGGQDGLLRALDVADGRQRWEAVTAGPIYAAPTVAADTVYCPSGDGVLYALALADGAERWRIAGRGPLNGRPAVHEGTLYFGDAAGRIFAADAATGAERWGPGVAAQGPVESQPVAREGRVFVAAGDSRLYALAAASGGEYWRYSTFDAFYAAPVVISDTVYAASAGGMLAALDVLSGEPRWELRASGPLPFSPAIAGDTLFYVASGSPDLHAVELATGRLLWTLNTGDWVAAAPLVANGALYLAGKDGAVLAYTLPAR